MRVIRIGERYSISTDEVETYDLLPVKTYVAMHNDKDGFYLTEHTNIEVREKIYGVHESKVKKVLHAFEVFQRSLGRKATNRPASHRWRMVFPSESFVPLLNFLVKLPVAGSCYYSFSSKYGSTFFRVARTSSHWFSSPITRM